MTETNRGITLVEMLTSLACLGLLLAATLPSMGDFIARQTLISKGNQILGLVHQARAEGAYRFPVLVCSSTGRCRDFQSPAPGLILIADRNDDRQLGPEDQILHQIDLPKGMTVQWRSFRNKPWLRINRRGVAYYQNGHFLLCYRGFAGRVILNRQARARRTSGSIEPEACP